MRNRSSFGLVALFVLAPTLFAQDSKPNLSAAPQNFFHEYQLVPVGNGDKYLLTLNATGRRVDLVVEPVAVKDGGPVTQYVLYDSGSVYLYTKTTIVLPGPNGGEGTSVEGISATTLPLGRPAATATTSTAASQRQHVGTSEWTSLPRKDKNFVLPIRTERVGMPVARIRVWLKWNGTDEIRVEPLDTDWKGLISSLTHFNSSIKFMSNANTESSSAPRFFYLRRNENDSITIFGDDDMEKLKAIEKSKEKK